MIDTDIIVARRSPFDRLPPGGGDSDSAALDRLAASLDYLTLCCGEPATEECGQRRAAEAIAERAQFLVGAVLTAGER